MQKSAEEHTEKNSQNIHIRKFHQRRIIKVWKEKKSIKIKKNIKKNILLTQCLMCMSCYVMFVQFYGYFFLASKKAIWDLPKAEYLKKETHKETTSKSRYLNKSNIAICKYRCCCRLHSLPRHPPPLPLLYLKERFSVLNNLWNLIPVQQVSLPKKRLNR